MELVEPTRREPFQSQGKWMISSLEPQMNPSLSESSRELANKSNFNLMKICKSHSLACSKCRDGHQKQELVSTRLFAMLPLPEQWDNDHLAVSIRASGSADQAEGASGGVFARTRGRTVAAAAQTSSGSETTPFEGEWSKHLRGNPVCQTKGLVLRH